MQGDSFPTSPWKHLVLQSISKLFLTHLWYSDDGDNCRVRKGMVKQQSKQVGLTTQDKKNDKTGENVNVEIEGERLEHASSYIYVSRT